MNNKKRIIITGDSWTDPIYYKSISKTGVTVWPELLDSDLNQSYEIVNHATMLGCNRNSIEELMYEAITEPESIEMLVFCLTGMLRFHSGGGGISFMGKLNRIQRLNPHRYLELLETDELTRILDMIANKNITDIGIDVRTKSILVQIYTLQEFCKRHNIKYKIITFQNPYEPHHFEIHRQAHGLQMDDVSSKFAKRFNADPMYDMIDEEHIWGWPFFPELGGEDVWGNVPPEERLSKTDTHPNQAGQKRISKIVYKFLKPHL